jgi:hypothetical protein
MEEKKEVSIFDEDVCDSHITRSSGRRQAVIIPLKKGLEMLKKMEKNYGKKEKKIKYEF